VAGVSGGGAAEPVIYCTPNSFFRQLLGYDFEIPNVVQ
jgi:hypothetical protein